MDLHAGTYSGFVKKKSDYRMIIFSHYHNIFSYLNIEIYPLQNYSEMNLLTLKVMGLKKVM